MSALIEKIVRAYLGEGVEALLIDETYSRNLQIPDPDREGRMIWVNEKQHDPYGYTSSEPPA